MTGRSAASPNAEISAACPGEKRLHHHGLRTVAFHGGKQLAIHVFNPLHQPNQYFQADLAGVDLVLANERRGTWGRSVAEECNRADARL